MAALTAVREEQKDRLRRQHVGFELADVLEVVHIPDEDGVPRSDGHAAFLGGLGLFESAGARTGRHALLGSWEGKRCADAWA
eukprot:5842693-Prymnesium_polylepis.1